MLSTHIISSISVLIALLLPLINLSSLSFSQPVERRFLIERIQSASQDQIQGQRYIDGLDINKCGKVLVEGWSSTQAYCNNNVKSSIEYRISGGAKAEPGRFPSYVQLITYTSDYAPLGYCGGTIISDDLVLTAAHCVRPDLADPNSKLNKTVGMIRIEAFESGDKSQVRYAKIFCKNTYFKAIDYVEDDGYKGRILKNDLALIQTHEKFDYNEYVQPACLNHNSIHKPDAECYIAGRGQYNNHYRMSNVTKYLPVKRGCRGIKRSQWNNVEHKSIGSTCYSSVDADIIGNGCPGDSGGPLYCMDRCDNGLKQYVVGAISLKHLNDCYNTDERVTFLTDLSKMPKMVDALLDGCHLDS